MKKVLVRIIIFLILLLSYFVVDGIMESYMDFGFCNKMGYDFAEASYLPYRDHDYGMLTCKSKYVLETEEVSFNVTYGVLGYRIVEQ